MQGDIEGPEHLEVTHQTRKYNQPFAGRKDILVCI